MMDNKSLRSMGELLTDMAQHRASIGRLLCTPFDVPVISLGVSAKSWSLVGTAPSAMLAAAREARETSDNVHYDVRVDVHPSRNACLAFSKSFGPWQHRFVLPLFGEEVGAFVRSLSNNPLLLTLASPNGTDIVSTMQSICPSTADKVLVAFRRSHLGKPSLFLDDVLRSARTPSPDDAARHAIAPGSAQPVVSLILEPALTELLAALA